MGAILQLNSHQFRNTLQLNILKTKFLRMVQRLYQNKEKAKRVRNAIRAKKVKKSKSKVEVDGVKDNNSKQQSVKRSRRPSSRAPRSKSQTDGTPRPVQPVIPRPSSKAPRSKEGRLSKDQYDGVPKIVPYDEVKERSKDQVEVDFDVDGDDVKAYCPCCRII